jgi:hypothetical protein
MLLFIVRLNQTPLLNRIRLRVFRPSKYPSAPLQYSQRLLLGELELTDQERVIGRPIKSGEHHLTL